MKRLVVAVLAAAGVVVAPVQAVAHGQQAREGQRVDIAVGVGGFDAPSTIGAGAVTFAVSSSDPAGAWLGLVRLRAGVSRERYLADLTRAMGPDPVEGGRAVARDAEMLGGVAVARTPAAVTIRVSPGDHLLVDFRDVGLPDLADRVRPVRVVPGHGGGHGPADQVVVVLDGRFVAPAAITGSVRVVNLSPHVNEAMLMPVRPGTTDADLGAFFRGAGPAPFTGGPTGVVPLSPGRSAVLDADLPAGPYALVTWVTDTRTGRMFAADGMRALVTVGG
ncbi:hypothetical protein AB0A74_31540 [Saccharothrix sp. NPDC042600]|uniref:hypothetical protein n=1 Tax=Saccharothrix TaxID=2071 RepID=UPI0033D3D699|nr:hypothetical protein GCM10017745_07730 [Saccharothrix mutabilis subsp. capreolus]